MSLKRLLIIILLFHSSVSFKQDLQSKVLKISCKYLIIEHSTFNKLISNNNYIYKLYQFESKNVKINDVYFKTIYNEFCLNRTSLIKLKLFLEETNSFIYGIDLSSNTNIDKNFFHSIIRNHVDVLEEINIKLVKYLNLSNNNINSITIFTMFTSLETLILDHNYNLEDLNYATLSNRLKVISLNKCNLNDKINLTAKLVKNQSVTSSLVYLGLADNKLTDMTSHNELNTFNLVDSLISFNIDILDLSFNRFHKLSTVKYLLNKINLIKKINLEKNLFSLFDINAIIDQQTLKQQTTEINFKFNFIRNTSLIYFKHKLNSKLSIKLFGNPLVCDCNSMWLLDEVTANLNKSSTKYILKNKANRNQRREIEEISSHHNLDDTSYGFYMQRQKRVKITNKDRRNSSIIQINDLDLLKCNFIDVQNYDSESSYDNEEFSFDLEIKKQNILVKSVKYREKYIATSAYEDFMCYYEDHCRVSDCDCCVFSHCHCRSICPRQCRCYFDNALQQNIIDCSSLNLIDVPNKPIELATDMRLNSNTLKLLNSHTFFGFGQLKYLYLQNNQISFIASDSFEDLKYSLKVLNLAENKLTYLNGDEFYGLNELAILVLSGNPLKDIDNINFIGSNHLPNLRFFYLADTTLPIRKLNELIHYSKKSTNTSIRYQAVSLLTSTAVSNYSDLDSFEQQENSEEESTTNRTKLLNRYFFYQFKLLNWYYFPIFVFVVCLLLSLVIVFTVVMVARKYETDSNTSSTNASTSSTAQLKKKSNRSSKRRRCFCCFYDKFYIKAENADADYSVSNFSTNLNSFEHDPENIIRISGLNHDYQDISQSKPFLTKYYSCFNGTLPCRGASCSTTSSFDSKCLDSDLGTVPVSKSVENLNLNVFVYFNVADNDYVANFLLPCLKKCLTIIPDTKYILKPQTNQYATFSQESFVDMSTKSKILKQIYMPNSLTANVLIISDHFYGYQQVDSLVSLKYKQIHNNGLATLNGNKSSSGISSNSSTSIYNQNGSKTKCYLTMAQSDEQLKNSFKIYLNFDESDSRQHHNRTLLLKDNFNLFNSSKTFSLNQHLMRRIYETSNKSISSDYRVSAQIQNDISSSYAFSEKLQFKLEKYFERVCLKSNKFSDNNFSFIDYTKRQ